MAHFFQSDPPEVQRVTRAAVEHIETIERIVEYTFWQLMLVDELAVGEAAVELLIGALRRRMNEVLDSVGTEIVGILP